MSADERRRWAVTRLLEKVAQGHDLNGVDASMAGEVPGWRVQRNYTKFRPARASYDVWVPDGEKPVVSWAVGPPDYVVTKEQLLELLRTQWASDAQKFLMRPAKAGR